MNRAMLFLASCIALATTSMIFTVRGDIEASLSDVFKITKEQMGQIWLPAFWGFTFSIFLSGALIDKVGMRILFALSSLGYIVGILLILLAPAPAAKVENIFKETGTLVLFLGFLMMGLSQGLVEGVINPLIATLYSDNKVHKLNVLHAWWPGGLMLGAGVAILLTQFGASWQIKLGSLLVPAVAYLILILGQEFPKTERVASGVSTGEMWKETLRPLYLLLFICMWLTAATELGPDQWFPSVMNKLTGLQGVWFLMYTAGIMFILRYFAGPLAHKISPIGMMIGCSVLAAIGLYWLGSLQEGTSAVIAFAASALFGVGKTYFWPTMLGIVAERFPKGGALLISLLGGAGMLSIGIALPIMGAEFDKSGPGAALKLVAILPVILTVVFAGLFMYFKAIGGYRAIKIEEQVGQSPAA